MLDTVGARVMALIVATTLPLAVIASFLAWHSYQQNVGNSALRTERDTQLAISEITTDLDQTHTLLDMLADGDISSGNALREFALVQTISQHNYCLLMLTDVAGRPSVILPPPSTQDAAICRSPDFNVSSLTTGSSKLPMVGVNVLTGERGPLLKFVVPILSNNAVSGYIVAVRTLGWQRSHLPKRDNRRLLGMASETKHFLAMPGGSLYSLFPDQPVVADLPPKALAHLRQDISSLRLQDVFTSEGTTYAFQNAYGPVSLIVATERTAEESRALNIFLLRVSLIVGLLLIELLAVAMGARLFLVEPLEKLASAVAEWRRGAAFAPRISHAIPLEIRHLEKAFLRATRRLGQHEKDLEQSARNQDMLIREIHHRVKNNLQVVASLLNLQASRIRSHEAREEFRLVRDRVRALATLHRYLYSENGLSALDVQSFLEELCSILLSANGMNAQTRIRLKLDIEHVLISPDQAVPIALIVTEVVSNALRYAFPQNRSGHIAISLHKIVHTSTDQEGLVELRLGDNGIGIDAGRATESRMRREGIGMQLIRGFARQINADMTVQTENGTWYILQFVPERPSLTALAMARSAIAQREETDV
ncbi:sensor histidine kinase [Gluconobacter kanchanaburiensis]|uniref:histidine kinase n=1 Tax=Gluconobacter kanchanaburiensis NBRC 103587 TaxID=1307948 RepID=A0A511B9X8_9PROT|nr:sensor histidine kinase [Gluconobacter kanchanaburiensis]MBF0861301.1 sensor histidine kinase [Gluconobacter kanchanaburiensis]GBR71052.1 two component hybrid sensor histidine kinase and regulator [Gluconobacter kanchanaburiensis NBRC 103587]GEK97235.1 histidine kinase [Gluconobacter kanchanaburiensis NBRC 103587]